VKVEEGPPLWGCDAEEIRFLEIHETRCHALGGRLMRDLGDAVLLFSPRDRDPFVNRVAAVRWPAEKAAFDARVGDILALFAALDRRPHIWASAAFGPPDLTTRLAEHGFVDTGGGYTMVLIREPPPAPEVPGVLLERYDGGPLVDVRGDDLRDIAGVLVAAFGLTDEHVEPVARETSEALRSPDFHVCLVREGTEPVAVAKRYTFDGATYLSSIGTLPGHRGRGLGRLVTDAVIRDGIAAASRYVYLGVYKDNDPAIELYRRLGMEILGGRGGDFVLLR
jgi:ribosomal protein S18 acetylase RimI-like enzyme